MTHICTCSRKADRQWDDWIARTLKEMGYQVDQVYLSCQPGMNGTNVYDRAISQSRVALYVVSDHPVAVGSDDGYILFLRSIFGLSDMEESEMQPHQVVALQRMARTTLFVWPYRSESDDDRLAQFSYQMYCQGQSEETVVTSLRSMLRRMAPGAGIPLPR